METVKTDITVVGGGLAGVCAAIQAARMGKTVALVHERPMLGGNSSSEVRVWTRGANGGGSLYGEEMGILGEIKLRNVYSNPEGNVVFWDDNVLDTVLGERNIRLFLNTAVTGVTMDGVYVKAATGFMLGSERQFTFESDYYIDVTGDGSVAAAAGVKFTVGAEAASLYGERLAPETPSETTFGSSILIYTRREDHAVRYVPPAFALSMETVGGIVNKGGRVVDENQTGGDYWWIEYGGLADTIADSQDINLELRRLVHGIWNYIKNSGKYDADNLTLEWIGAFGGKRERRRMLADYMLNERDVVEARSFDDNAFYGGWFMDFHPSEGFETEAENCIQIPVRAYPIPFRTLFSSERPNVLFAGRIIGVSHVAFSSTRITDTCAGSGQAAGALAAYCATTGKSPARSVAEDVLYIQKRLAKDDAFIMQTDVRDEADLALSAAVSASSTLSSFAGEPAGAEPLNASAFVCFPALSGDRPKSFTLYANAQVPARISVKLHKSAFPSRRVLGELITEQTFELCAGDKQPFTLTLPPQKSDAFIVASLDPAAGVSICAAKYAPVGFLMGMRESPEYSYPLFDYDMSGLYAPENVINGVSRPFGKPNIWVSDSEPAPYLQLEWDCEKTVSQVRLTLNPNLTREIPSLRYTASNGHHYMAYNRGRLSGRLEKDFAIWYRRGGEWIEAARISDNWRRLCVVDLPKPVTTDALRIVFARSDGKRAQAFEIRVY
ncbi:MAG: FAD-dependent oxidoreductase [Clostridiales bacterium]|nr:FAD-dependent oxidoreductase [Clostridiales bacterium]